MGCWEFKACPPEKRMCVYVGLTEYLVRTRDLRIGYGGGSLILFSYVMPHGHVARDTISRWIGTVLDMAGIDSKVYGGGSVGLHLCLRQVPMQCQWLLLWKRLVGQEKAFLRDSTIRRL